MRIAAVAALVLVAAAPVAAAAPPSLTPLSDPEEPPPPQHDRPTSGAKSETAATALAFGTTAAGYVLAAAIANSDHETGAEAAMALMVIGPSAGHLYAGESGHALGMSALRAGGLVTFALGLLAVVATDNVEYGNCPGGCGNVSDERNDHSFGAGMMIVGGTAFVVGTAYDLYDAHRAVRRANDKLVGAMQFTPTMIRVPNGMAPGMALTGRF
jgi:hypothetical protein